MNNGGDSSVCLMDKIDICLDLFIVHKFFLSKIHILIIFTDDDFYKVYIHKHG